jgi:hypothetical protein
MGLVEEEKVARCAWGGQMASCEQEGRKGCSMASHTEERRGVGGVLVLMCDHGARGLALPAETGRGGGVRRLTMARAWWRRAALAHHVADGVR